MFNAQPTGTRYKGCLVEGERYKCCLVEGGGGVEVQGLPGGGGEV